jgi:hypothetical protein
LLLYLTKHGKFRVNLRQKDWQVVLDQGIGVDDGLVEVLVQDFPGKENKDKKFE